jgi:hypothetical protein
MTDPKTDAEALRQLEARKADMRAAFEAGHWAWPSPDAPTRSALCEAFIAFRLGAPPRQPQEGK